MIKQNSLLLRGCSLKLTDYIIGLVIYTGHDTKIMRNSPKAKSKTSRVEDTMNEQILTVFLFQAILSIAAAITYLVTKNVYIVKRKFFYVFFLNFLCFFPKFFLKFFLNFS